MFDGSILRRFGRKFLLVGETAEAVLSSGVGSNIGFLLVCLFWGLRFSPNDSNGVMYCILLLPELSLAIVDIGISLSRLWSAACCSFSSLWSATSRSLLSGGFRNLVSFLGELARMVFVGSGLFGL